jgi:hypothetical protein
MKTSNKLLLGLIIAILLIITLTVGMAKYQYDVTIEKVGQSQLNKPAAQGLSMKETKARANTHFPVAFILLPQLQW